MMAHANLHLITLTTNVTVDLGFSERTARLTSVRASKPIHVKMGEPAKPRMGLIMFANADLGFAENIVRKTFVCPTLVSMVAPVHPAKDAKSFVIVNQGIPATGVK